MKELILTPRASACYETEIRDLLAEKDAFQRGAADAIAVAEERVSALGAQYENQVRLLSRAQERGLNDEAFPCELQRIHQQLNTARGTKRANCEMSIVTLRSAPDAPKYFAVGRQRESASEISSRTRSSSSTQSRETSLAPISDATSTGVLERDAICPIAQAACPRISGSASGSPAASTGTASGEPQFPSATATFLGSPRRIARFTGEFLKRRENSA